MARQEVHIGQIRDADWPEIMAVQASAFPTTPLESSAVLRSKWLVSPQTCFASRAGDGAILGYLLAHPWPVQSAPPLFEVLEHSSPGNNLFLHDLAVRASAQGRGIGQALVARLYEAAREHGFASVSLVAVQGASPFWSRQGFVEVPTQAIDGSYGDGAVSMQRTL